MRKFGILIFASLFALAACQPKEAAGPQAHAGKLDAEKIRAHIEFLADDLLEGRETGERGYDIAAKYVATQYKLLGLKPGNDKSYFQDVTFRRAKAVNASATLMNNGDTRELVPMQDFVLSGSYNAKEVSGSGELVFVGSGVHAPDFGYSDYEGIDVNGKIVMMLRRSAPENFPSDERAYFSSNSYKLKEAISRGAKGVLMVTTPKFQEKYSWERVVGWAGAGGGLEWVAPDGSVPNGHPELALQGMLSYELQSALFEQYAPMPLAEILEKLKSGEAQSFAMPVKLSASVTSEWEESRAPNVVGVLEGSDPQLKNEYVLYSGHLDHIGLEEPKDDDAEGDVINNGAYDNATGIGIMLDVARVFSEMETKPKRSIVFLAVTAEEKGLLGSEYWAEYPTLPIENVSANVNVDMPVLTFPLADVIAYGAEHSELGDIVRAQAATQRLNLSPDPWPEEVIFVRSDQYSFVKQGVPAVFLVPGWTSSDPSVDGEAEMRGFEENHYHGVSDDLSLPFNMESAKRFAATNFLVGLEVANRDKRVSWKEGDFFGKRFGK